MNTLILAGLVALSTSAAFGAVALQMNDGTTTVTVNDNGPGDTQPLTGVVGWNGTIGTWNINSINGLGTLADGGKMDLSYNDHTTAAGTLTIEFSQNSLSGPFPALLSFGGTEDAGFSVTYQAYSGSGLFDLATLLGTIGPFTSPSYSGMMSGSTASGESYSLTEVVTIHANNAGQISGDANLAPVPEPASLLLLGPALLFAGKKLRNKFGSDNSTK